MAGAPLSPARAASRDASVAGLLAANAVAAVLAVAVGLSLRELMFVYWLQSVVIGGFHVLRLLCLRDYSTDGMKLDPRYLEPSSLNKWRFAIFFTLHYGLFHLGYLAFLATGALNAGRPLAAHGVAVAACALGFVVHHAMAFRRQVAADRTGRPSIGTLMMMPYFRVVPMHLAILAGDAWASGAKGLLFFIALKTGADVLMHLIDRSITQPGPPLLHRLD